MTVLRTCACGCGAPMEGRRRNARYATDACRTGAWRSRTGYRLQGVRNPSQNGNRRRSRKPSDVRVSFTQLVDALGRDAALQVLTPAQRSRLPR